MANDSKFPSKAPAKLPDNEGPLPQPVASTKPTVNDDIKTAGTQMPAPEEPTRPVAVQTEDQYRGIVQQVKMCLLGLLESNKGESRVPVAQVRTALNILGVPDSDHPGY